MAQRQVLKCGKEMQRWTKVRGNSLLQRRTRIRVFQNVQGNLPLKIWTSKTRMTRSGRTISAYLELTYHTLRKSSRIRDYNSNASQKTKWKTSMWIRWYGGRLCWWPSKPQFIWARIFGDFTFKQKSATRNNETIVRCNQEASQWTSVINWQDKSWKRTTLLNDRAVQLSTAKVFVFSDSALCMGRTPNTPVSAWKEKLEWFMNSSHYRERYYDVTQPRIAVYENNWKIHQNKVYWCNVRVAQSKELQFYRTRSNAIILCNTLLAMCIEKVVIKKSGEELYNKTYQFPFLPQRVVLKPSNMDARIPQALTREHQPTILASTGKPVAVKSAGKPVAVR